MEGWNGLRGGMDGGMGWVDGMEREIGPVSQSIGKPTNENSSNFVSVYTPYFASNLHFLVVL